MPSSVLGGTTLRIWARNCRPKLGLVCHWPSARTTSPGATAPAFADHGRGLALVGELDPEHAKAGLGIVEDHPLDQAGQRLRGRLGGGQRERHGGGRGPVLALGLRIGLHGAPNLNPAPRFDKRGLQPGSGSGRRCRRTSSVAPNTRLPITNGIR